MDHHYSVLQSGSQKKGTSEAHDDRSGSNPGLDALINVTKQWWNGRIKCRHQRIQEKQIKGAAR